MPPASHGLRPRPRSLTVVPSERKRSSVSPVTALARLRRAGGLPPTERRTPHPVWDRADPGPLAAFSSLRSVGMAGRPIPSSLQSEKRTQRPNLVAIAESPFHSDSAGRGSVLLPPRSARRLRRPRRCRYGPLLRPAIHRKLAVASDHHLTTSRGPRNEAPRNSGTPTVDSLRRMQLGGGKFEIRNSKFEISPG